MKYLFSFTIIFLLFSACRKNDSTSAQTTTTIQSDVMGEWALAIVHGGHSTTGVPNIDTIDADEPHKHILFRTDGSCRISRDTVVTESTFEFTNNKTSAISTNDGIIIDGMRYTYWIGNDTFRTYPAGYSDGATEIYVRKK